MRGLVGMLVLLVLVAIARAQPADWGPKRDPFDRVVIAKYQQLLAADPHDAVLAKLVDLYKRYRTLALLLTDYDSKLAATPDDWGLIVLNARLREAAGDKTSAADLYARALADKPGHAATALKLAGIQRATGKLAEARDLLEATLVHVPQQREVVKALADLAYLMRDRIGAATYLTRYVELDPNNARAHVDRGDALMAIGFPDRAAEAYALAEKLYGTDAARRLDVIAARGRALEKSHPADADAEYRRAIALAPRGHYLREELFTRLVDLHKQSNTVNDLLARTLTDWPEATRGVFEWTQIAAMFDAIGHKNDSTAALEKAVAKSADARLHLQLADRYGTQGGDNKRAFEVLDALAVRMQRDVGVLISIAERYARWGHLASSIKTYEQVMRLDATAEIHLIGLVENPLRANDQIAARTALRSVVIRLKKSPSFRRLGEVLLEWGMYREADEAFSLALKRDDKDPATWRGRAATRDSLGEIASAVADAERVIILTSDPKERRIARKELVRIVMHASSHGGARTPFVDSWRDAFNLDPPDIDAGFLLLEYYARSPCESSYRHTCDREVLSVLERLSEIATIEFDDILALATSHAGSRRRAEALEILSIAERIAPDRKADIEKYRARMGEWRARSPRHYYHRRISRYARRTPQYYIEDPDDDPSFRRRRLRRRWGEAIEAPLRAGVRIGAGAGVRGGADHVVTVGTLATARIARNVYLTSRLDYTERETTIPISGVAMSFGVGTALHTGYSVALIAGLSQRIERRFGDMIEQAGLSRVGFSTDLTLDLVGRKIPLGIGTRIEQSLSEDARSTAVLLELTLELR